MVIEFFEPMQPPTTTHQMHKVAVVKGKVQFYEPEDVKAARAALDAHIGPHRPELPCSGSVRLGVKWCFPAGESHADGEPRITRPDVDNLTKLLLDVMTANHYWRDDSQVYELMVGKYWARVPGLYVRMEAGEA